MKDIKYRRDVKWWRDGSGWVFKPVIHVFREGWSDIKWRFDPTWIRQKFDPWVRAIPNTIRRFDPWIRAFPRVTFIRDIFPGGYVPWNFEADTFPAVKTGF